MFKSVYLLSLIPVLLVSCTVAPNKNTPVSPKTQSVTQPVTKTTENPAMVASWATSVTKESTGTTEPTSSSSQRDLSTVEGINSISTLDDLKSINPAMATMPGSDHPKFVELQKKQITLGLLMSKLTDPELQNLRKEINDIFQWKDAWTPEVKKMEKEFTETLAEMNKAWWIQGEWFKDLLDKRNQTMKDFQTSKEFKDYLESKQDKIAELNEAINKYNTPEIISLQKEIQELNVEVYTPKQ